MSEPGLFDTAEDGKGAFDDADESGFTDPNEGDAFAQQVDVWDEISQPIDDETPEVTAKRVLNDVESAFKSRAQAEDARYKEAVDGEFWICVVFQTHAQKDQFLKNAGVDPERHGDKYIDGWDLAKVLKVPLDKVTMRYNTSDKLDRRLIEQSRGPDELPGLVGPETS